MGRLPKAAPLKREGVLVPEHYDVIVIGSGAGVSLEPSLTPWLRRARASSSSNGEAFYREKCSTGTPMRCLSTVGTFLPRPGMTRTARPSSRRSTTSSGEPPSCTAPPSIACVPRTSASCNMWTASRRPGTRRPRLRPYVTQGAIMSLEGKVAIVTGGNSGIGKAIVLALAEQRRQRGDRLRRHTRGHRGAGAAGSRPWATRPSGSMPTSARSTTCRC